MNLNCMIVTVLLLAANLNIGKIPDFYDACRVKLIFLLL